MNLLRSLLVLCAIGASPAVCSAGLIPFELTVTSTWIDTGAPLSTIGLQQLVATSTSYNFDTSSNTPIVVPLFQYNPQLFSTPTPGNLHPGGWATWNLDHYFGIDLQLTDLASGQSTNFDIAGRMHAYNSYSNGSWSGVGIFWFMYGYDAGGPASAILGGNQYTVWSEDWYSTQSPSLSIWVGANPPVVTSPEPGTILLAGLGILPVGLRAGRRRLATKTQ